MSKKNAIKKLLAIGSFLGLGAGTGGAASALQTPSPGSSSSSSVSGEISISKSTLNNKINTRIGEKKAQADMLADRVEKAFVESLQSVRKVPGKPRAVYVDIAGQENPLEIEIAKKSASEMEVMQILCEKIVEANINSWYESIANKKVKDVNDLEMSIYKYLDPKVQATVVRNSIEDVMTHRRKLSVEEFNSLSKSQPADEVNKEAKSIISGKGLLNKAMQSHIRYFLIDNPGYYPMEEGQGYGQGNQGYDQGEFYWQG